MIARRRALASALTVATMFLVTATPAVSLVSQDAVAPQSFPDVPSSHPFNHEITWLIDQDVTTGYDDGTFRPTAPVSRMAMAAFMYRLAGEPEYTAPAEPSFSDVTSSHPFVDEIEWMAHEGISTGYGDGTFRPNTPVSRQAMAAFMYRLAGHPTDRGPGISTFVDVEAPDPSRPGVGAFYTEVMWMAQYGIATGYGEDGGQDLEFRPGAQVSRQAMAAFMYRLAPLLNDQWSTSYVTECNDGIDNDGDGWVDWAYDLGCYGPGDTSERAGSRPVEVGWTTYDKPSGDVYYVSSSDGSDSNDGLSPDEPFATLDKAFERYQRGGSYNDYVLLKRGDTFEDASLNLSRYSGLSAEQPMVVATYGESTQRPVIELSSHYTILSDMGDPASYRAFHGLDFYFPKTDPGNPAFDENHNSSGISFIGLSEGLLFEDTRFRYGGLNIQGEGDKEPGYIADVEIRRSVIANSWSPECGDGGHKQGSFISNIHGLTLEENVYHHNGWNEEYGCATMFNHNVYVTRVRDVTFTNNAFLHSSSIGVKFSAFAADESGDSIYPGTIENVVFANNLIADSEVGVSMGGNGTGGYRFRDIVMRGNVFSELGADEPTDRPFSWGLEILDNDNTLIEHNYFVDSPWHTNNFGISLGDTREGRSGKTNRDVTIRDNLFYDYTTNHVKIADVPAVSNVTVIDNTMVQGPNAGQVDMSRSCLVRSTGGGLPAGVGFSGNAYHAEVPGWFCIDGETRDLAWWQANYESTATEFTGQMVDPGRTLDDYASHLGLADRQELEQAMMDNSRLTWDPTLTVAAINDHVKDGYRIE